MIDNPGKSVKVEPLTLFSLKIYICICTVLMAFPNLPIPGRYSLILVALSFCAFIRNKNVNLPNDIVLKTSMVWSLILCISMVNIALDLDKFDWKVSVLIKQMIYFSSYCLIFLFSCKFMNIVIVTRSVKLFLIMSCIYLAMGVIITLGLGEPFYKLINAREVLSHGRLSITEPEPSIANLKLVVIPLIASLFYRKLGNVKLLLVILVSLFLIIQVKSKATIVLLPLTIFISFLLVTKSNSTLGKRLLKLGVLFLSSSVALYFILQSDYFQYSYHYTVSETGGSALSRFQLAMAGVGTILQRPFGSGVLYYPFIQGNLLHPIFNLGTNSELVTLMSSHEMNSMLSPKSGLITWGVIGGVVFLFGYIKFITSSILFIGREWSLNQFQKVSLISLIIYCFLYSCVSDITISFVVVLGFIVSFLKALKRGRLFA